MHNRNQDLPLESQLSINLASESLHEAERVMKIKFDFTIKTSGTTVSLFLFKPSSPTQGEYVKLKVVDGKRVGESELSPGSYGYILNVRAGKPKSDWLLAMKRADAPKALERKGSLDGHGDGGRVGEFAFS